MDQNGARSISEHWVFLRRFLKNPRAVGAISPSSRYLARHMVGRLEFRPGARVVELGPGTGALTRAILDSLPADGRYLGIERDPVFVRLLEKRWPEHSHVCDSVENLVSIANQRRLLPLDHIISGLPFASLPEPVTLPILDAVLAALRPGGTFTTFQYVNAYPLPAARKFRREMERRFGTRCSRETVIRNIPPAFVLSWRKESTA